MRIVVLVKPVPDPASGAERLGPDRRLDRAAAPAVVNGNDEYALEAALKLVEEHGGEVILVSMAPPNAPETMPNSPIAARISAPLSRIACAFEATLYVKEVDR